MKDRTNQVLQLRDGRSLGYAEYGKPGGKPLVYFHGIPGSRKECLLAELILRKHSIRLIVPERPGYGCSNILENRRIQDWPEDVVQLADHLVLDRFAVLGFSGGGSYALACAQQLKARITAVGLLACLAPFDAPGIREAISPDFQNMYALAAAAPEELAQDLAPVASDAQKVLLMLQETASTPDKAIFSTPVFRNSCLDNFTESLRQGSTAVAWDLHLAATSWGIDLAGIQQPVRLWHGTDDRNADVVMGSYLADTVPHCRAQFMKNEGHYSLFNHMERILQELMGL